ncbi:Peptidoglycan deacetylase [Penicillium chrysogenum]|uniref:Pc21g06490 protein n=2 Tax=Penicillium chrysogenum species complex TaxID=254878 RepID=B6HJB4_PENRW|nr:Peptidoglycan deacetylase [Penicillium chrysogenum]CAP95546.1 Pc21g06490 [Penicillium rubens Wisconsin 54-1255]
MTSCLSNKSIIVAGASAPFADDFRGCYSGRLGQVMEKKIYPNICQGAKNKTLAVNLDPLVSTNLTEAQAQINTTFGALGDQIHVFIIDTRTQEPSGRHTIWEIPLSEWDQGVTPMSCQRKVLVHAKLFLQHQFQASKVKKSHEPQPGDGFCIVILGYQDLFGDSLDQLISKLQRDASRLHPGASVNFLDLSNSPEASTQSIAAATAILVSAKPARGIIPLDNITSVKSTKNHNDDLVAQNSQLCTSLPLHQKHPKVKIALSFDFDAVSAFLGTGDHPDNNLADYSTGIFAGRIGANRILRMLQKHQVADKVTWFIPGHTMETFEPTVKEIIKSGAEIGLHGYSHEGAYQMTPTQERDVLVKCMEVCERLTGKRVRGYRAPMCQLRETTIELLREFEFLYDSSLSHHDSQPYFTPSDPPIKGVDFSKPASTWLRPTPLAATDARPVGHPLVEIPTGWNNEDMMALQYFPHLDNSHGHVDVRVVEQRWKDMFLWLWENADDVDGGDGSFVFPILMHPDTSGMSHVIGMVDRFVGWLRGWGDAVQFRTFESIAREWLEEQQKAE